jgi:hypothetical protein
MSRLSIQQIRGLKDLIQEAIEAGVNATEEVHQTIARQPYALLQHIAVIAVPVQAIEHVQTTVTSGVYHTILSVNRIAGMLTTQVLDGLDVKEGGNAIQKS